MAKIKLNDAQYDKHDVLELEIDVRPHSYVWDFGLLKGGKQTIEVHAVNLPKLVELTSDEDEVAEFQNLELQYHKKKSLIEKELKEKFKEGTVNYDKGLYAFIDKNNPYKRFVEINDRDPKPIKSIKVIENKGPRVDDLVAAQKSAQNTNAELVELMKSNAEFMKMMTQLLAKQK